MNYLQSKTFFGRIREVIILVLTFMLAVVLTLPWVIEAIWAKRQLRPKKARQLSCSLCHAVAIPGDDICPECFYEICVIVPDPFEEEENLS